MEGRGRGEGSKIFLHTSMASYTVAIISRGRGGGGEERKKRKKEKKKKKKTEKKNRSNEPIKLTNFSIKWLPEEN